MSITFLQQPETTTPSDNPVTWVFSSTQYNQPNFAFLVQIYVNGILKQNHYPMFPENNGDTLHFDASDAAMLACAPPVPKIDLTDISYDASNYALIKIKVTEYYGSPATAQGTPVDNTVYVFKACLHDDDFPLWVARDYEFAFSIHDSKIPKFMSLWPRGSKYFCGMTEQLFLMFLTQEQDMDIFISLFDADDNLIVDDAIGTTAADNYITMFNVSPKSIAANSLINLADFTNCAYYNIYLSDYDPAHITETFRVYVDRRCDNYGTKRLHYLSSIGSMEAFSFTKANTKTREITHNSHEKQWGRFNDSNAYEYSIYQGREKDHRNTSTGRLQITSDWLNETIQNFIANELYESPYVFMEKLEVVVTDVSTITTFYKRVKVLNTTIEEKQKIKESLFQLSVDLNTSDARKSALV